MTRQVPFKLTAEDRRIMDALAKKLGLTRAAVLRVSIRLLAKREQVK